MNDDKSLNLLVLIFSILALLYNTILQKVGTIFFAIFVFVILYGLINKRKRINNVILLECITVIIIYCFSFMRSLSINSIKPIFSLIVGFIIMIYFSTVDFYNIEKTNLFEFFIFQLLIIFSQKFLSTGYNIIDGGYKSIFTTTTFLGIFSCLMFELSIFLFFITQEKKWILISIFWLYLVFISKVRTAMIGVFASSIFVTILVLLNNNKQKMIFCKLLKWFIYCLIISVTLIYPIMERFCWYESISNIVYTFTGKVLLSGRQIIWKNALELILDKPFLGYGLCYTSIYDISPHNSYLNIILQVGFFGLFFLFVLINTVINKCIKLNNNLSFIMVVFSLSNILICTTEVMLLSGQIVLQILIWIMLGLGFNNSLVLISSSKQL